MCRRTNTISHLRFHLIYLVLRSHNGKFVGCKVEILESYNVKWLQGGCKNDSDGETQIAYADTRHHDNRHTYRLAKAFCTALVCCSYILDGILTLRMRILSPGHPRSECQSVCVGLAVTAFTKYTNLRFVKYISNLLSHALDMRDALRSVTITVIFVANEVMFGSVVLGRPTKQAVSCSTSLDPFQLFVLLTSP